MLSTRVHTCAKWYQILKSLLQHLVLCLWICTPVFLPGESQGWGSLVGCRLWGRGFDPWVGKICWRRKWQSTPVLLPGKSHGQRSLVGYSPRGCKESDTTERLHLLTIRPAPAALPAGSQPQWRPREHNWDRPPPKAI